MLRPDFRPDSDVDVPVSFAPEARWTLFDLVTMQDELEEIFGREVDLVEREGLRNPFRRRAILYGGHLWSHLSGMSRTFGTYTSIL